MDSTLSQMTKPLIIFFMVYSVLLSFGQSDTLNNTNDSKSNILKITPLKLVGLVNPGIEIGIERKTSDFFSTQLSAVYLLPKGIGDYDQSFSPNIKGYVISVEEKFYIKKTTRYGLYVGLELNYLKNHYTDIGWFAAGNAWTDTTIMAYEDTFNINKQTFSINLKGGFHMYLKKISIDLYAGLGMRYKNVLHSGKLKPNDVMMKPIDPSINYISNLEGEYWTISIPINIKIGWIF